MTDHPRDEFDKVPESSARQGVHRQRLIPAGLNGLALKITVGVLALLIGVGAYFILPRLGFVVGGDGSAAALSGTASSTAEAQDASAEPSTSAGSTSDAEDEAGAEATSTRDADDETDRAQTVNVLNATGAPGQASVAAARLAAEGWTSALPGNWTGAPQGVSVIFYNGEAQRAAAEAVAADLGITNLVDSPEISPDISVVLGPEFR